MNKIISELEKREENILANKIKILFAGVYDPGIFKAIFLAGGPGSGKSFISKKNYFRTWFKIS